MSVEQDRSQDATVAELSPAEMAQVSGGLLLPFPPVPWWIILAKKVSTVCR